jgi:hypothetical protein
MISTGLRSRVRRFESYRGHSPINIAKCAWTCGNAGPFAFWGMQPDAAEGKGVPMITYQTRTDQERTV